MPVIQNTAAIPAVAPGLHLLEIEGVETVEGTKYGEPDVPETRLKMALKVRTKGEPPECFNAWMSAKLGAKATFGGIVQATLGAIPSNPEFDTDVLLGKRFYAMVTENERGWPTLVNGTAGPVRKRDYEDEPSF